MNAVFFNMITAVRSIRQLYGNTEAEIASRYGLSKVESAVLAYLYNNPGHDTLSDISYGRRIKKANASVAVTMLERKGFLGKKGDERDRRVTHLFPLPPASDFLNELSAATDDLLVKLLAGFDADDISQLDCFMRRLEDNARMVL